MDVQYRFARQRHGLLGFAEIFIEVTERSDKTFSVTEEVPKTNVFREFVEPALRGCRNAAEWLASEQLPAGYDIKLKQIGVSIPDTEADAVECAAFLAVAKAFARENQAEVEFDERWKIVIPS